MTEPSITQQVEKLLTELTGSGAAGAYSAPIGMYNKMRSQSQGRRKKKKRRKKK